jgi:hypothetical protein
MSFAEWEGTMGAAERYHRKLMWLAERQEESKETDERERQRWIEGLEPPKPEDFRLT